MPRRQKEPLRPLTPVEYGQLVHISRSPSEQAAPVAHAKALLAVAAGQRFTDAARAAGRRSGDAVAQLVARFNQTGLAALQPGHGGGPATVYGGREQERILAEVRRTPDREVDGTATWSLTTLQRALRRAADGLPRVSTSTIWCVLQDAGLTWQRDRSWCETGSALRKRKSGTVTVHDPDAVPKTNLIEAAYTQSALPVWTEDEAGPFPTVPYPGQHWRPSGAPTCYPHEYLRQGTAKQLTLFHPASGAVRVKGVTSTANAILHPWLEAELTAILAALPAPTVLPPEANRRCWERWQEALTVRSSLPQDPPPLRLLLVLDNLTGHYTADFVRWLFAHGIMPLYTPLGGSWLNMAESIQRILKRRALDGQQPTSPEEVIGWLEAAARGWNRQPTPFVWGGKRHARRERAWQRRHALGGSGAQTDQPLPRRKAA
jgi:transposase